MRLIASRLKWFLHDAVQNNQVGFVSGRLLCENVLRSYELAANFHKGETTTRGCLQIVLTNAYDNLDWRFIIHILKVFDLPPLFIGWSISSPSNSIALNGELVGVFQGKRH